jgi:LmbE family N-acetylglucosaminyl deacetylase
MLGLDKCDPILLLCPHPDDEIGCGAVISRLKEEGHPIYYCCFSTCAESTIARGFDPEALLVEMRESCGVLGIPDDNIFTFDIPVRHFPQHRQEILETMIQLRQRIKPRLVLTPASFDIHQDHSTVAEEAARAFKHANVLGFELIWNALTTDIAMFVQVEQRHLDAKIKSWQCYKTQAGRAYHGPQVFEALARVRGMMANCELAEAFQVRRLVV